MKGIPTTTSNMTPQRVPVPLMTPRGGIPPVIDTDEGLLQATEALESGTGPIGIDTERASGYRYSQRAYLVQLYREEAGTFVIDPTQFPSLEPVARAVSDVEHIFHAASQDLPSLREAGYAPHTIFDTELSARLLGFEHVGLGPLVEEVLGIHLAKAHSASDWSTRPLPDSWISYAALDVQLLPQLREILATQLHDTGKWDYAQEEFAAVLQAKPRAPRAEPWRRLSGIHSLKDARQLAIARSLWHARDRLAQERDIAQGRIIPDSAIIAAAAATPASLGDLAQLSGFIGRNSRSDLDYWWASICEGIQAAPPSQKSADSGESVPPVKAWKRKNPVAANRLTHARAAIADLSSALSVPQENLLNPRILRHAMWEGKETEEEIIASLRTDGARQWQIDLTVPVIVRAVAQADAAGTSGDTAEEPSVSRENLIQVDR